MALLALRLTHRWVSAYSSSTAMERQDCQPTNTTRAPNTARKPTTRARTRRARYHKPSIVLSSASAFNPVTTLRPPVPAPAARRRLIVHAGPAPPFARRGATDRTCEINRLFIQKGSTNLSPSACFFPLNFSPAASATLSVDGINGPPLRPHNGPSGTRRCAAPAQQERNYFFKFCGPQEVVAQLPTTDFVNRPFQ